MLLFVATIVLVVQHKRLIVKDVEVKSSLIIK